MRKPDNNSTPLNTAMSDGSLSNSLILFTINQSAAITTGNRQSAIISFLFIIKLRVEAESEKIFHASYVSSHGFTVFKKLSKRELG